MGNQPVWLWMNLLSLDAPLVALVWQDFVARCYGIPLLIQGRLVLGLTVWAIYIADRVLERDPRYHRFYRENRAVWILALIAVVMVDILVTLLWLRPLVFVNGLVVASASVAYLAVFTGVGQGWVFWKKAIAAILFSSGVFVVAAANISGPRFSLLLPWAAFAVLCWGNLLVSGRVNTVRIGPFVLAAAFAVIVHSSWYYAIAASALCLAAIAYLDGKLTVEARRVLADFVLFTPLLLR